MNLNLIEMLTIFQLITIRNRSDGNNVNHKQLKGKLNKEIQFLYSTLESSAHILICYCIRLSSALKIYAAALGRKRLYTSSLIDGNILFCRICRLQTARF